MFVVVVDDDDAVRRLAARMLEAEGHRVLPFRSAESALARLPAGPFLLLTDLELPGQDGLALWRTVRTRDPSARGILMSGALDDHVQRRARAAGIGAMLKKPFSWEELGTALRDCA